MSDRSETFRAWLLGLSLVAIVIFGINKCTETDWYKANEAENDRRAAARATPHVIRVSTDGCKVYAFEAGGSDHFFTRCADQTVTTRNYTVSCGKNQTCKRTEEISSENKKDPS